MVGISIPFIGFICIVLNASPVIMYRYRVAPRIISVFAVIVRCFCFNCFPSMW